VLESKEYLNIDFAFTAKQFGDTGCTNCSADVLDNALNRDQQTKQELHISMFIKYHQ
jgi:hypothetical protein